MLTEQEWADIGRMVSSMGSDEIRRLNGLARTAWEMCQKRQLMQVHVGQKVSFRTKDGRTITGRISKVNRSRVKVRPEGTLIEWNVSPGLLQPA